ncbi:MaoC/PaaZ C-terminal domain-containing protein [Acetivibrio ethanolgignens]|uniref:Dehydratase n=1 Tax=Acetivibrio ethanolgignens TaxID=290052 RepID=A0A0V8QE40_9FIRM|nr:MaoC/PaaZ C-terminal domain-containing protein [Acetivibrio ethanolgignens]KSV58818.1 dehydratase [Acetivibrio ethanolgignens]
MNDYRYEEIEIGTEEKFEVIITKEMMEKFKDITGDVNPLHCDKEFAALQGYPSEVVYGMLTASFYSTLGGVYLPGKYCLIHSIEVKFSSPVYIGDRLLIEGKVTEKNDIFQFLTIKVTIRNQHGKKVSRGIMKAGVQNAG